MKAREHHAKVEHVDPNEGSNPADDKMIDVLQFQADDTAEAELAAAVQGLNEDELLDLIALIWVGRGELSLQEWNEARASAGRISPRDVPTYLLSHPLVSDELEEGLAQFGHSLQQHLDGSPAPP